MTITTENPTTDRERGLPCVVRHPEAGGQCERTATVRAFGLRYCGIHGEELTAATGPAEDRLRALVRAYPNVPERVTANVLQWEQDEGPNRGAVADSLLSSLGTLEKVMRVAHEDGEVWLVELLELERESTASQAAYALRDRAGVAPV